VGAQVPPFGPDGPWARRRREQLRAEDTSGSEAAASSEDTVDAAERDSERTPVEAGPRMLGQQARGTVRATGLREELDRALESADRDR